jgi:hypothetical protein
MFITACEELDFVKNLGKYHLVFVWRRRHGTNVVAIWYSGVH